MKKLKDLKLGFGITFGILFVIWVILIGIGASIVVGDVPVHVAESASQIDAWRGCYQASWAFLAAMLVLIAIYVPAKDSVKDVAKAKIDNVLDKQPAAQTAAQN